MSSTTPGKDLTSGPRRYDLVFQLAGTASPAIRYLETGRARGKVDISV